MKKKKKEEIEWTVEMTPECQEQFDRLPLGVQDEMRKVMRGLVRNPYLGNPLNIGLFGERWLWHKIRFVVQEIKLFFKGE